MKKKILFVSHDATRTGAPMILLHLLRWLKANDAVDIHILLLKGGELAPDFAEVAPTLIWNKDYRPSLTERVTRRLYKGKVYTPEQLKIRRTVSAAGIDLVYLNTVVSAGIISELLPLVSCKFLCHVHENEYTVSFYYPDALNAFAKTHISHYIAVSESTKKNLVKNIGIPAADISICYEFVPTKQFAQPSLTKDAVKKSLGLTNEFIVGGSGLAIWRKGIDLFVQLAIELKKLNAVADIKLVWVGTIDRTFQCGYDYEKKRLGVEDDIILTGPQKDPQNYFQVFDVFVLTSREDPFPLVSIEAASLAKPILCFENSGGMVEFLKDEKSQIIPYGDVREMAAKIIQLKNDAEERARIGAIMEKNAANYDVEKCCPIIYQTIMEQTHVGAFETPVVAIA